MDDIRVGDLVVVIGFGKTDAFRTGEPNLRNRIFYVEGRLGKSDFNCKAYECVLKDIDSKISYFVIEVYLKRIRNEDELMAWRI